MAIQRILVPVDYSAGSGAALTVAAKLAAEIRASIDVVHVWDRPTYVAGTVLVGKSGAERPLTELIRENAEAEMKAFIAGLTLPAEVPLRTRLLSGNPASRILEELRVGDHDLVVMGTHGRTGLKHVLLGSVAEKVVRLSPVMVLTVPMKPVLTKRRTEAAPRASEEGPLLGDQQLHAAVSGSPGRGDVRGDGARAAHALSGQT